MPHLTDEERLGSVLASRYRLDCIIGQGGMGTVFGGEHEWTGRPVAIKLLKPSLVQEAEAIGRLRREARAGTTIRHPNAVEVLDLGRADDGAIFVVMELLEGECLRSYLHRHGRLPTQRVLDLMLPVMGALTRAHDLGFIHRDLKPDNIFVATDSLGRETTKLLDFGVAKALGGESLKTVTGALLGTPIYMSPEQLRDSKWVTPASDVWSIGIVLYELLCGETPFAGANLTELAVKVMLSPVPSVRERVPALSEQVAGVIDQALQREPNQRFSDMRALTTALIGAARNDGVMVDAAREAVALPARSAPSTERALSEPPSTDGIPTTHAKSPTDTPVGLIAHRGWKPIAAGVVGTVGLAALLVAAATKGPTSAAAEPATPPPVATAPAVITETPPSLMASSSMASSSMALGGLPAGNPTSANRIRAAGLPELPQPELPQPDLPQPELPQGAETPEAPGDNVTERPRFGEPGTADGTRARAARHPRSTAHSTAPSTSTLQRGQPMPRTARRPTTQRPATPQPAMDIGIARDFQ